MSAADRNSVGSASRAAAVAESDMSSVEKVEDEERMEEDGIMVQEDAVSDSGGMPLLPNAEDWGLDPAFWARTPLFIKQIQMELMQGGSSGANHVLESMRELQHVEILGTLVAKLDKGEHVRYVVDDGSGTVDCIEWRVNIPKISEFRLIVQEEAGVDFKLGALVYVCGKLKMRFTGMDDDCKIFNPREIIATTIELVNDPNVELFHWARVMKLMEEKFSHPPDRLFKSSWMQHFRRANQGADALSSTSTNRIRNEELQVHEKNESKICSIIHAHLESKVKGKEKSLFTFREIVEDDPLWRKVQHDTYIDIDIAKEYLDGALRKLIREGRVFVSSQNFYGVVTFDDVLKPAILVILGSFQDANPAGIPHWQILPTLHTDNRTRFVNQESLEGALRKLQELGLVFESKRNRYKLVMG